MNWIYKDQIISVLNDFPPNTFGFIYKVTHIPTGKSYIGKKAFIYNKKKKLTKKELLEHEGGRGRKPTHKVIQTESDWLTYYGSHPLLKEYSKSSPQDLKREILYLAASKKELTYLECKYQFSLEVLESNEWLNDNILGKFFKKDFDSKD